MTVTFRTGHEAIFTKRRSRCGSEANGLTSRFQRLHWWIQAAWGSEAYSLLLVELYKYLQAADEGPIC